MSTKTLSKTKPISETPPNYKVMLLNDDYTPMDFVVFILKRFFRKSDAQALKIMIEAHEKGLSIAGIYPLEEAETKVQQVLRNAKKESYPLQLILEPE